MYGAGVANKRWEVASSWSPTATRWVADRYCGDSAFSFDLSIVTIRGIVIVAGGGGWGRGVACRAALGVGTGIPWGFPQVYMWGWMDIHLYSPTVVAENKNLRITHITRNLTKHRPYIKVTTKSY